MQHHRLILAIIAGAILLIGYVSNRRALKQTNDKWDWLHKAFCPNPQSLADYAAGTFPAQDRPLMEMHLATCSECRGTVAALREAIRSKWKERP